MNNQPGDVTSLVESFKDAHDLLESRVAHYRSMLLSDLEECFNPEGPKALLDSGYYDRYEILLESHLAVVRKLRHNIDKLVRFKKGENGSEGEVKAVSKQVFTALSAHHLDDYTPSRGSTDWEAMAQTAITAAVNLVENWKHSETQQQ